MEIKVTCASCQHFEANLDKNNSAEGFCFRYPPVTFPVQQGNRHGWVSQYPPVQLGQHCGEYQSRVSQ